VAFSCHSFITQNIVKNPNKKSYPKIIIIAFIISLLAYNFYAFGSFGIFEYYLGIINRIPFKAHPETIYDYFRVGDWQVFLLQFIHLLHFTTAFPNFMIVSK
jgi:amino acid transporter